MTQDLEMSITTKSCLATLNEVADTNEEDPESVYTAQIDPEKLSRQASKLYNSYAANMLSSLNGVW
jgi:hypothetical protein